MVGGPSGGSDARIRVSIEARVGKKRRLQRALGFALFPWARLSYLSSYFARAGAAVALAWKLSVMRNYLLGIRLPSDGNFGPWFAYRLIGRFDFVFYSLRVAGVLLVLRWRIF